jgi:hypothetical protein
MPVDTYGEWLQAPERLVTLDDAVQTARWGDSAEVVTVSTVLDVEADANAEATRHFAFKGGPLVEEEIIVARLLDVALYRGRVWTVQIAGDAIYGAGLAVFVLGGDASQQSGTTRLFIVRKL